MELLVAIAIIGILVALLLPAVQAAREAARRSQCTNHLKQIGLAILNYEQSFRTFPIQFAPYQESPEGDGNGWSWMTAILPFVEEQNLYDTINPRGPVSAGQGMIRPENRTAIKTPVPIYYCPTDNAMGTTRNDVWMVPSGIEFAVTNYAGVLGPHDLGNGSLFGGLPDCHNYSATLRRSCTGAFWRHSHLAPVQLASFTDGLSNTIIVGEVVPEYDSFKYWALSSGSYAATHSPINYWPQPNDPWTGWYNQIAFRSRHNAGAHFLWGDGHVSLLEETIDQAIYRGLSTRAGRENTNSL